MAPEQVRGQALDQRADLFAFGAILYEMLTGRRAFRGETAPDTMAAILNDEPPDLRTAAPQVPPAVARIVERCLEKNPAARFQTASDLAFAIEGVSGLSSETPAAAAVAPRARRGWLGWSVAALLFAALAPIVYRHLREPQPAREAVRFEIAPKVQFGGPGNFAVSPDGRRLAFVGRGPDGVSRLWVKAMDSLDARELPGTEVGDPSPPPFWSPDSRFVAFYASGKLKKLDVSGGLPQPLCDLPTLLVGGSWNRNGDIIVGNIAGGILHVSETGGTASPVTALESIAQGRVSSPAVIPSRRPSLRLRARRARGAGPRRRLRRRDRCHSGSAKHDPVDAVRRRADVCRRQRFRAGTAAVSPRRDAHRAAVRRDTDGADRRSGAAGGASRFVSRQRLFLRVRQRCSRVSPREQRYARRLVRPAGDCDPADHGTGRVRRGRAVA